MHRSIIIGQLSLIVCCIFYLIWWSLCYKPNVVVDRLDGIRGALLLITALCGLVGVCFSVHGMGMLSVQHLMFSGSKIIGVGILTYCALIDHGIWFSSTSNHGTLAHYRVDDVGNMPNQ